MKSIKVSDYFEFKYPKYIFLKLTPSTSVRNYNSDKILLIIASLYRSIFQQIKRINNKLFFECSAKASYYIYMQKNEVEFYFIVPEAHFNMFKEKLIDTWNNRITITIVSEIPLFKQDCTKYYMTYKKEDAMSLSCDKRNNVLLGSLLNTLHVMEEGDKVGVFYNFNPCEQKAWRSAYDNTIQRLKDGAPISKNKLNLLYVGNLLFKYISTFVDIFLESLPFVDIKPEPMLRLKDLSLSTETEKKREALVVDTQILCFSESGNKFREADNAISLCSAFECLDNDNKLISKRYRGKFELLDLRINGADTIKVQPKEGQNFISIPGRELLEEHKVIEHTNVLETEVPAKLRTGYISLGINTCRGAETEAFLRDNYDQGNFPLVLIGEQGSGKTTFISNYVNSITSRNEGCLLIDFIKNCELSDAIKKVVPAYRIIEIDMSDIRSVQGIGYNELIPKSKSLDELLDVSNRKSNYIQMLIDALNVDGDCLSTSMDRYLSAASNIVFLDQRASLKDVVRCLNNHEYRKQCIDSVPNTLRDSLDDEIGALKELDDKNSHGDVVGTKTVKIDGINHRINLLRKDLRLKLMFQKSCENNIDLVKAMNEGKIILIKMPQEYFATPYSKNVIVTYWLTKVWCATLIRGSREKAPRRFHVLVDEIFQSKTSMQMLKNQELLPQTRKFGLKFVVSCQYLKQIELIDHTLRSAGASYMLMKGSGKANFNEFKDELVPYTLEDMEALPQYHSLNVINYEEGRAKFITKLPRPL